MKFGQLTEYNKGNIFIQKPCRKWARETTIMLKIAFDVLPNFLFATSGTKRDH